MMETDVTLFNPNTQEKLILDAKFYREALVSKFGGREKVLGIISRRFFLT